MAVVLLLGVLGACGDDDDPTTTAADDDTTTTAAGGDSLEKYCDTIVKIETTPEPTPAMMGPKSGKHGYGVAAPHDKLVDTLLLDVGVAAAADDG